MKDNEKTNNVSFPHEITQRINTLIYRFSEGNRKNFGEKIGIKQQSINRLFNIDKRSQKYPKPSDEIIDATLSNFPDIDRIWLITGEGEMISDSLNETKKSKIYRVDDDSEMLVVKERLALYEEKIEFYKEKIEKLDEENKILKKELESKVSHHGVVRSERELK